MVQELREAKKARTLIGVTGSFGSGKSTVAEALKPFGVLVLDADRLAHEALEEKSAVISEIRQIFEGDDVFEDRKLNRAKIAGVVFSDKAKRAALERIVHPYVFRRIAEEIRKSGACEVVVEVPLLFESGFEDYCDYVIVVKADDTLIDQRLQAKGFTKEQIEERRKAQMPLEEKVKKAGFVIDNSGDFKKTCREVEALWRQIHPVSKGAKKNA